MSHAFTADTKALADFLSLAYEGFSMDEIHPAMGVRYWDLAADLVNGNHPREPKAIAEPIALRMEDAGHLDQVAPWDFVRHLDVAHDILATF